MKMYEITFNGRKLGSIGEFSMYTERRQGDRPEAAILALYEAFDHVRVDRITEVLTEEGPR